MEITTANGGIRDKRMSDSTKTKITQKRGGLLTKGSRASSLAILLLAKLMTSRLGQDSRLFSPPRMRLSASSSYDAKKGKKTEK